MTAEPDSCDMATGGGVAPPTEPPPPTPLTLLPVRALGDFAYCPRLAWLWWRDGAAGWTVREAKGQGAGSFGAPGPPASPDNDDDASPGLDADGGNAHAPLSAEFLSSPDLGLEAVVWTDGTGAPVLVRSGTGPGNGRAWPGDEDMVAAHGLLL